MPKIEVYQYQHGETKVSFNLAVDDNITMNRNNLIACLEEALKELKGEQGKE